MAPSGSGSGADRGPRRGDRVRLSVSAFGEALRGSGRAGELEVIVPGALPGEVVDVEIEHIDRRRLAHARLLQVIAPAPERVPVPCPRFLDCSGCDLLHTRLSTQHAAKRALVARALGVPLEDVDAVVPSPRTVGYRALAKLVVGPGPSLGSYRARSHDVADMAGCVVHAPEVEWVVDRLRRLLSESQSTSLRYVLVRGSIFEGRALAVLVTASGDATATRDVERLARALEPDPRLAAVYHHVNSSSGDELLGRGPHVPLFERAPVRERILDVVHTLLPGAFAQVNPLAAERLYARVVELAAPSDARVLDLYSGSGGIALALARAGATSVTAVESIAAAVRAGEAAAVENDVADRVAFLTLRAEAALRELVEARFDVVTLNPPRKGAAPEVLEGLARLRARRLVYVSCSPETLARDLALLEARGFARRHVTPVDLFPETRHVETVVLLERAR